jgi:hypothetical protein
MCLAGSLRQELHIVLDHIRPPTANAKVYLPSACFVRVISSTTTTTQHTFYQINLSRHFEILVNCIIRCLFCCRPSYQQKKNLFYPEPVASIYGAIAIHGYFTSSTNQQATLSATTSTTFINECIGCRRCCWSSGHGSR